MLRWTPAFAGVTGYGDMACVFFMRRPCVLCQGLRKSSNGHVQE